MADQDFKSNISIALIETMAADIARHCHGFDVGQFTEASSRGLDSLELKARVQQVSAALVGRLPADFSRAAGVIRAVVQDDKAQTTWRGFPVWPLTDWVRTEGLADFDAAMTLLEVLTSRWTGEFAVRPYIRADSDRTMARMTRWARSDDTQLRRLASEGCRPRLPWGGQLRAFMADPAPVLAILELLKDDTEDYVRRSVANNLNDIAKDHPQLVVDVVGRWMREAPTSKGRLWVTNRALRTLIKSGHPGALAVLGFDPVISLELTSLNVSPVVEMPGNLQIDLEFRSTAGSQQRLAIDYVVHHVKKSGVQTPKVFKWAKRTIGPGDAIRIRKIHKIRPISTRRYYPGTHRVHVQINGNILAESAFELVMTDDR